MSKHLVYGLLYIILLPFAFMLGLSVLTSLPLALSAPIFLIPVFIMACFVIYTVATLIFYVKAIQQQKACKPSLRDLIRVNAFVVIVPTVLFVLNGVVAVMQPALVNNAINQFKEMQQQPLPVSPQVITAMLYALLVFAIVMLIHIIYTFRLLRDYKTAFEDGGQDNL